ncbi:MAG: DUF4307 domain-containing protein [Rhodoglobus sp.]
MSSPQPPSSAPAEADLDARYGRTPRRAQRARVFQIVAALAFVAVFTAWVVWGGLFQPASQFEAKDVAHTIVSDSETQVTWEFSTTPGTSARCAVQALNSTFAIVGWKVVDVPPSDRYTRTLTESVLTTELAVSGLIYGCWLT